MPQDIQKISFSSQYSIDRIINTEADGSGSGFGTTIYDDCLPIAIYTLDGGITWNDCAYYNLPGGFTIEPATPVDVYIEKNTLNNQRVINFTNSVDLPRYAILALPDRTYIDSTFSFSGDVLYRSSDNYLKIAVEGEYNINASSYQVTTITHNLGYAPLVNVWVKGDYYNSSTGSINRIFTAFSQLTSSGAGVTMDETNIYIHTEASLYVSNSTITIFYRIYYEE